MPIGKTGMIQQEDDEPINASSTNNFLTYSTPEIDLSFQNFTDKSFENSFDKITHNAMISNEQSMSETGNLIIPDLQSGNSLANKIGKILLLFIISIIAFVAMGLLIYFIVTNLSDTSNTKSISNFTTSNFSTTFISQISHLKENPTKPSRFQLPSMFPPNLNQVEFCGVFPKINVSDEPMRGFKNYKELENKIEKAVKNRNKFFYPEITNHDLNNFATESYSTGFKSFAEASNNTELNSDQNYFGVSTETAFLSTKSSTLRNTATATSNVKVLERRRRVIGGNNVKPGTITWQVAVYLDSLFLCGGSIVTADWILTAAHCIEVSKNNSSYWMVYAGMVSLKNKRQEPAQNRLVSKIYMHPNFSSLIYDYDVALLRLDRSLQYNMFVQPICLPLPNYNFPENAHCYVSGWGETIVNDKKSQPDILQFARIKLISLKSCDKLIKTRITSRMICAGLPQEGKDSCSGDSGGPLSYYDSEKKVWVLAGSSSWGMRCGTSRRPGVYSKTSFFTEWIWETTGI